MNKKSIHLLSFFFAFIFISCNGTGNKNKVYTQYLIQGGDTVASYISVENTTDTIKNYVIIQTSLFSEKQRAYSYERNRKLDSLMLCLGVETHLKEKCEKQPYITQICHIWLSDTISDNYKLYSARWYDIRAKYKAGWFDYAIRPLIINEEQQLTIKKTPVRMHVYSYKDEYDCFISSDEVLNTEEIQELMKRNHIEDYHEATCFINCIGSPQIYATCENGLISYEPNHPLNKEEANKRGIKDFYESLEKDIQYRACSNWEEIKAMINRYSEAYNKGTKFYENYNEEHPYVKKEYDSFKKHIIRTQKEDFQYLRNSYARFSDEQGMYSDIDVKAIGERNKTIVYTSYLFSDSDNIDELYDGMKKILKNLRFEWAEFKVTKYSKSTARYIGGKEDHVID